jgi:TRAP-type C4-dicarboxylate transport system permease small subunit
LHCGPPRRAGGDGRSLVNWILDRIEELMIGSLMAAATAITFVAVVHRYGASNSAALAAWATAHGLPWLHWVADQVDSHLIEVNLSWAQELATYMFVWMAEFGAALGVRTGIHVGVDVLVNRLTPAARIPVIVFALLCGALFTGVIGTLGAIYVYELDADQVSQELEWPSWIIYLCIPLGSYLMCYRFLQVAWKFVRSHRRCCIRRPTVHCRPAAGPRAGEPAWPHDLASRMAARISTHVPGELGRAHQGIS